MEKEKHLSNTIEKEIHQELIQPQLHRYAEDEKWSDEIIKGEHVSLIVWILLVVSFFGFRF